MVLIIIGSVLVLAIGLSIFVVVKTSNTISRPTLMNHEDAWKKSIRKDLVDWNVLNSIKQEPFSVESSLGYTLNGKIFYQEKPQKRTKVMVLLHGWTSHYSDVLSYYNIFYKRGYNIVCYDQRYHGYSEGPCCTMGYYEHQDLVEVCAKVREIFGKDCVLGLFGESMGAATVMLASPKVEGLSFTIEDCGYESLIDETDFMVFYYYHILVQPFMPLIRKFTKKHYNFDYADVKPIEAVRQCENLPMLFIHGDNDVIVPSRFLMQLVEAKKGFKMYKYFKGSAHAASYLDHTKEYDDLVGEFLEKIGCLD